MRFSTSVLLNFDNQFFWFVLMPSVDNSRSLFWPSAKRRRFSLSRRTSLSPFLSAWVWAADSRKRKVNDASQNKHSFFSRSRELNWNGTFMASLWTSLWVYNEVGIEFMCEENAVQREKEKKKRKKRDENFLLSQHIATVRRLRYIFSYTIYNIKWN